LAEITDGFSGAELKNLINEAAILTAREKRVIIGEKDLFNAFEKIIVGLIRNNNAVSLNTRTRVAVHESGHAIMALRYPDYFDLQKVSIQATYSGAGGYTIFSEKPEIKEGGLYTRDLLKKRLIVTMGGKAAENVYYGNDFVSLGAIQDLKQANQLAQKMIGNFGMGEKLEVFFNENINDDNVGFYNNKYSEYTKFNMDKETMRLVIEAYNESLRILNENKDLLYDMRDLLLNNTVINKKDIPHYFF
jgi:cell division protease FtsH